MRTATRLLVLAALVAGCGGSEDSSFPNPVLVEVGPFDLAAGEETDTLCFSYTLNNNETLYVSRVAMEAGFGFHHSNWLFVPDHIYPGPDGLWQCSDRGFDTALAAATGGVLFAQSTQATEEVQEFDAGAAIPLPPHSKIVANIHVLNASGEALTTQNDLTITTLPEDEVTTLLAPIYLQYAPLTIEPHQDSEFMSSCDIDTQYQQVTGHPLDIKLHYVLPHYHSLGTGITLETVGGANDGDVVFRNHSAIGEPLGGRLDPPYDLSGATGLRFGCDFSNPTDSEIGWGIGDQEMCIVFGFAESEYLIGGGVMSQADHQYVGDVDGVAEHEGKCTIFLSPRHG